MTVPQFKNSLHKQLIADKTPFLAKSMVTCGEHKIHGISPALKNPRVKYEQY